MNVKNSSKKNTPPNTNTISEIQTSDLDHSVDTDDNENDSVSWKTFPNMVITSEDSDSSNPDGQCLI